MNSLAVERVAKALAQEHCFGYASGYKAAMGSGGAWQKGFDEISDYDWEDYLDDAKEILNFNCLE